MDFQSKEKSVKKTALFINSAMLLVHIGFSFVFFLFHYPILGFINIGSACVYAFLYLPIEKKQIMGFIKILMTEIWLYLISAVILLGWECGFELYCFGMISFSFYARYLFNDNKQAYAIPNTVCAISIFVFLALRVYTFIATPIYTVSKIFALTFYCFNSGLVFFFMALFLYLYTVHVLDSEHNLHEIADYDELTELFNRHRMRDILSKVYEDSQAGEKNFCTTIIDIDDFKIVNDTYGHEAGDYVLKAVSAIMQKICKEAKGASVGRWGGEEFLVVQEYEREKEQSLIPCINTIKQIHDTIRDYDFVYNEHHILITVTAGISAHQEDMSIAATIKLADERLYRGKLNGKNCVALA